MAPRRRSCTFEVAGLLPFPLDMLRRDCCYPVDPEGIEQLAWSLAADAPRDREYRVRLLAVGGAPNVERWESFSWRVFNVYGVM